MDSKLKDVLLKAKSTIDGVDIKKIESEVKDAEKLQAEQKANEVMHSTNTGYGKELIPTNVVTDPLLDQVVNFSYLMDKLPGMHGGIMSIAEKVPVIGEAPLFGANSEWTTGDPLPTTATQSQVATGEVTINQGQFILNIDLSKRELNYSVIDLENLVKERINRSAAKTIDYMILNGDSAAANNVNLDGGTPSGTNYLQIDGGIRDEGIGDSNTVNIGTFETADFISLRTKLGNYGANIADLLFIMPVNVYLKIMGLTEVVTMEKFGNDATIKKGILAKLFGIDILVTDQFPSLTASNGKISSTGGSNTLGSCALIYKPAVQYGFGQPLEIDTWKVPGKGVRLTATFEFGFGIAYETAGLSKTCAIGINGTL